MKDKDLPNDYESSSLEELTLEANKIIEDLESQKDLQKSIEKYQNLINPRLDMLSWILYNLWAKSHLSSVGRAIVL